jgi:hypothetical protein
MTNGQIAQLQELARCWCLLPGYKGWVRSKVAGLKWFAWEKLTRYEKMLLRRLWHAYRGQIRQMRKNRKANNVSL